MEKLAAMIVDKIEDAESREQLENLVNTYIVRTGCAMPGPVDSAETLERIALGLVRRGEYDSARVFAEAAIYWRDIEGLEE